MALVDLLYRCHWCGTESMRGEARWAECEGCGRAFEHVGAGGTIRVLEASGRRVDFPIGELLDPHADRDDGGAMRAGLGSAAETGSDAGPGEDSHETRVRARFADREEAIRYRGTLLGFVEHFGRWRPGTLRLDRQALRFSDGASGVRLWALRDLRAVQTSSSVVQISPPESGVAAFRFLDDSPRRWEDLLRAYLQDTWKAEGRGEIIEFQPHIRSR